MAECKVTIDDIRAAHERIQPLIHHTPLFTSTFLNSLCGSGMHLYIKNEAMQKCGAFKARGAFNAVLSLDAETRSRGVITHSSGNHAGALAHAAQKTGIPAHIVMPSNALKPKRAAVLTYGGHVYECEPTQQSRENVANKVQQETGAVMIPPYDYDPVIAGQGTVALEILGDAPQIDTIIVPCGGGGLLSGVAIAAKALNPNVKVYGAEPAAADDAYQSVRNGVRTPLPDGVTPKTIADGLRTTIGHRNWSIIKQRELVHDIVTVSEEEIVFAMRTVWERMKIIIEPSSAVAVAAALKPQIRDEGGRHVAIVISGGNVDLDQLPW